MIKETVHHFTDLAATLAGLAGLLAPGGRFLVVSLPPRLEYPLFDAALGRFAERQPEPDDSASALRAVRVRARAAACSGTSLICSRSVMSANDE